MGLDIAEARAMHPADGVERPGLIGHQVGDLRAGMGDGAAAEAGLVVVARMGARQSRHGPRRRRPSWPWCRGRRRGSRRPRSPCRSMASLPRRAPSSRARSSRRCRSSASSSVLLLNTEGNSHKEAQKTRRKTSHDCPAILCLWWLIFPMPNASFPAADFSEAQAIL